MACCPGRVAWLRNRPKRVKAGEKDRAVAGRVRAPCNCPRAAKAAIRNPRGRTGDAGTSARYPNAVDRHSRCSDLLGATELDERQRRWVEVLKGNAEHLAALTTLVVDATRRKRRANWSLQRADVHPPACLAEAVAASLAARAQKRAGLSCKIEIAEDLPDGSFRRRGAAAGGTGKPDRQRREVHAARRGRVVGAAESVGQRHAALFAVSDSGIGMTADRNQATVPAVHAGA